MSGLTARALAAHDRGETASGRPEWSVQRGGSAKGTEESVRTSQGTGREGEYRKPGMVSVQSSENLQLILFCAFLF